MFEKRKRFDSSLKRGGAQGGNAAPKLPCFQFQSAGSCSYGNACRFLHEQQASSGQAAPGLAAQRFTRPQPAVNGGFGGPVGNNGCRDFERGRCTRGISCKYAHAQQQSGQGPPPRPRSFAPFTHPNNTPQSPHRFGRPPSTSGSPSGAMLPCRDFARGMCRYGGSCRFKH
jgi:hypothetical protein